MIKATPQEQAQGIESLSVTVYRCRDADCRRLFYWVTPYAGLEPLPERRVRPWQIASIKARIKQPQESDWVWGHHREHFYKVKVKV